MSETANSKTQAGVWLKPDQVDELRTAVYRCRPAYLQQRDEAILALMYDTGLRVGELVALDVDYLREDRTRLFVPGAIQKDYPTDSSPDATRMVLASDTTRVLSAYLSSRWKDTASLFPSRQSDRITTQGVRDLFRRLAREAGVEPFMLDGSRGEPDDVTPHALRHSVAYRMMNAEEGHTLYDVRNRLRHRSIQTTERVYDHLVEV
jgi:integrase/recombinase XerC/integrase/recombinase XerD